jgi:hypothetical protein
MFRIMWRLLIIFLCGYLFIEWFPIYHPFLFSDFFIRLIINPLEFFAAALVFFIAVIINAQLFNEVFIQTVKVLKKRQPFSKRIFLIYPGLVVLYFSLFQVGVEQTLALFCFSFLYGMISVER